MIKRFLSHARIAKNLYLFKRYKVLIKYIILHFQTQRALTHYCRARGLTMYTYTRGSRHYKLFRYDCNL